MLQIGCRIAGEQKVVVVNFNFFPLQHHSCARLTEEARRVLALNLLSCHLESNGRSKVDTDDASRLSDEVK
jgi:hypothetical protein